MSFDLTLIVLRHEIDKIDLILHKYRSKLCPGAINLLEKYGTDLDAQLGNWADRLKKISNN